MKKLPALFALLCIGFYLRSQETPIPMGAPNPMNTDAPVSIPAPENVVASDGTYDKFVLVRWDNSEHATAYKVFRTTDPQKSALQEVTPNWQKSTWVCDYTAVRGVKYFYIVVAGNGAKLSATSRFDKGFVRDKPLAIEDQEALTQNEAYGAPHFIYLLASDVKAPESAKAGTEVALEARLQNIFDLPTPQTEIRVFLSTNTTLDWDDTLLGRRNLSSIPPNATFILQEKLIVPGDALPGEYYLIVVCSSAGDILNSKTDSTIIQIVR